MSEATIFLDKLSNWYIRRNRRRFWKSENDSDKYIAYQTLYDVILDLIKVLSPVLPFVTERMYLNITSADKNENKDSIHLSDFPKCDNDKINHELIEKVINIDLNIFFKKITRKY